MCEYSEKTAAWLDEEISIDDAVAVEHHLGACKECRGRLEMYRRVSGAFEAYCDAYAETVMVNKAGRKRWRRVLASTLAAAAAVAAVFLVSSLTHLRRPIIPVSVMTEHAAVARPPLSPDTLAQTTTAPASTSLQRDGGRPARGKVSAASLAQSQEPRWSADEPMLEIAIPGDAIFAPGALPEDLGFTADVTFAPDGWPQQMQMRPHLAEFERRATQP